MNSQTPDFFMALHRWYVYLLLYSLTISIGSAQISERISRVNTGTIREEKALTIQIDLVQSDVVERIELAYRQFGETNFRFTEMSIAGNVATATLPASSMAPPFLEYYFALYIRGNAYPETYPLENALQQPLKITIPSTREQHKIVLLSPEESERVPSEDVLISFSLINFDSTINRSQINISVDNVDLSAIAIVTGDLVIVKPNNLSNGNHAFIVEIFDQQGKPVEKLSKEFIVASSAPLKVTEGGAPQLYHASIQLESRNENISDNTTLYNRATVSAKGHYDNVQFQGRMFVTNEEKESRQPQNRFFVGAELPWLKLGYGDNYPVFPDLIMSGKRVRGFTGNLTLGGFNLDVARGDITRRIESEIISTFPQDSLSAEQRRDPYGSYGVYDAAMQRWAKVRFGTFNRDILIIRPSFGKRDGSHIGFTYVKSRDDLNSIRFGIKPQENFVLGSDILLRFDNRNVEFFGQAAISATNRDITKGTFSNADIDSTFKDYSQSSRDNIKTIRDIVSQVITVNENLVPLNDKNLPTLSYEAYVLLNYFENNVKLTYLRHGETYESFGQSYLRQDIGGFNIFDRVRLIQNQLFLSGGFERLEDNTVKTKATTTTGTTVNVGISFYPRMMNAPNVTVAYLHTSNANSLALSDSLYAIDDGTNRVTVFLEKEFVLGQRHTASLSISTSRRDDHTYRNLDTRNTSMTLSNNTQFSIPLQTLLSVSFNASKFVTPGITLGALSTALEYTTFSASAQYQLLENRLRLNGSLSPTFGDIERVVTTISAQYDIIKNISVRTDLGLYFNSKLFNSTATTNDVVWSVTIRADI